MMMKALLVVLVMVELSLALPQARGDLKLGQAPRGDLALGLGQRQPRVVRVRQPANVEFQQRRYSSGYTSGSPTAAPTTAPASTVTTQIQQVATFTHFANAAAFTGATKTLYERGYGSMLGLCANTACSSYKTGNSVTSEASDTAFRRANVYIRFTATASSADAVTATAAATTFAASGGATSFVNAVTAVKAADTTTFANVAAPTAAQIADVATPSVTVTSGASSVAASWCLVLGAAFMALRQ